MFFTKNLKLKRLSKKLTPKFIGFFRVKDVVGKQAYKLFLSNMYLRLYLVFLIIYLELYKERLNDFLKLDLPMPNFTNENAEYKIKKIID